MSKWTADDFKKSNSTKWTADDFRPAQPKPKTFMDGPVLYPSKKASTPKPSVNDIFVDAPTASTLPLTRKELNTKPMTEGINTNPYSGLSNEDIYNQRAGWSDKLVNKALSLVLPESTMQKIRNTVVEDSMKPQIDAELAAQHKNINDFSYLERKSPFVHNVAEQGRSAMTAGAYIPDQSNVKSKNKVLDFASNMIGQGVGMALGGDLSTNNMLQPIGNSAEYLAQKGLSKVAAPKLVNTLLPSMIRGGAEFGGLNAYGTTQQGGSLKDTALSGLEGFGTGAVFGGITKGIGEGINGLKTNKKLANDLLMKDFNSYPETPVINNKPISQPLLQLPAPRDYSTKVNILPKGETPIELGGYKESTKPKVVIKKSKITSNTELSREDLFKAIDDVVPSKYKPNEYVVDWGSNRGQGKRSGKMVLGSMGDAPRGKKTYTNLIENVPEYKTNPNDFKGMDKLDQLNYIKAREYGLNHNQARVYQIAKSGRYNLSDERIIELLKNHADGNADFLMKETQKPLSETLFSGYVNNKIPVQPKQPIERISAANLKNITPIVDNTKVLPQYAREDIRKPLELSNQLTTKDLSFNVKGIEVKKPIDLSIDYSKVNNESLLKNHIAELESAITKTKDAPTLQKMNLQLFAAKQQLEVLANTKAQIVSKTVKEPLTKQTFVNKANETYIKTVDDLARLNQFDTYYEEVTGRKLSPEKRAYYQGLNSRGADMTSRSILLEGLTDREGKVVGESLKDITKDIPKNKYDDFTDYLINKHAETRMKRGEKVFDSELVGEEMTAEKSKAKAEQYEKTNPEFKDLANRVYEFNNKLGKTWLVDTGIISPETWAKYLEENPFYVPNQRHFSSLEKPDFKGSKRGFANQSNPIKKATGSARKIIDPIETMIEHVDQYVKTAKRNETMQNVINMIKEAPEEMKGFAEVVPSKEGLVDDINKVLQEEGIAGVLEKFNQPFDKAFQKQNLSTGNIVAGLVNGKKVHVKVNDAQFLDALTNLNSQAQNIVLKAAGALTRVLKTLTTGINPVFSLTRNVFRDIPTAYTNSKSVNNPLTFGKDLFTAFADVVINSKKYKEFKAIGGGHSSPISSGRKALLESKNSILPSQKTLNPLKIVKNGFGKGVGFLEKFNDALESAPRLAEYKRLSKNGDYGGKVKGLFEANDVTVNFNKRGEVTKSLDSIIPYVNAAVQGLDKLARTFDFKGNPKQAGASLAKAVTSVTIPSIILYAFNHDNPDYQQINNTVKDNNFLIPKGDGTFFKIPKPRELGVMFGSDVERAMRQFADKEPEAWKDFATTVKDSFAPPVRTVLAPFSDLRANKDFANRPIVPGDLAKLSPKLQYDANTSTPAKFIGEKFNVSPKQVDYIAKSYGGGLAELGLPALTPNVSLAENLKRKVTVDPAYSNDILRDFYNTKDKLDQSYSDNKHIKQKQTAADNRMRIAYDNANDRISKIRKQIKEVQNDKNLSSYDKLARIRTLQQSLNDVANNVNKRYK